MTNTHAHQNLHVVALVANERGARVFEHLIGPSSSWVESPPLRAECEDPERFGRRVASFIDEKVDLDPWLGVYVIAPKKMLDRLHGECSPHARLHFIDEEHGDLVALSSEQICRRLSNSLIAH